MASDYFYEKQYPMDAIPGLNNLEIKLQEKNNEIESFVILDDDSDMLPKQMSNFIHIDGQVGLTDKDVFRAIEILNR